MRNTTNILGIPVDNVTLDEAMEKIESFLNQNELRMVFTPNSEIMMAAQRDSELKNILCNADLLVPDGAGVVLASKILGSPLKERVAGFDLTNRLLDHAKQSQIGFFLFGGKPGIADEAAKNLLDENASIKILGIRHGYFTQNEETDIIQEINSSGADVLLVALGLLSRKNGSIKIEKLNIKYALRGKPRCAGKRVSLAPAFLEIMGLNGCTDFARSHGDLKECSTCPFYIACYSQKMGFLKTYKQQKDLGLFYTLKISMDSSRFLESFLRSSDSDTKCLISSTSSWNPSVISLMLSVFRLEPLFMFPKDSIISVPAVSTVIIEAFMAITWV